MSGTESTKRSSPIAMYDLTIPDTFSFAAIKEWVGMYCKKYCFQKERGSDTGYVHYQCRISLNSKKRHDTMIRFVQSTLGVGIHTTPTCSATFITGNDFYVMKEESRIDGPWTDKTDLPKNTPKRLANNDITWRPWQKEVIEICEQEADDRTINVIVQEKGNVGKTFLSMWLTVRGKAERIPPQKEARDIMRMVMDLPKCKIYFIDLPRATSHKDQRSIYAAIEEIKNGYAYDDRYNFKREFFEPPHVWVFTNEMPNTSLLSEDRWTLWTVNDQHVLVPYTPHQSNVQALATQQLKSLTLNIIPTPKTLFMGRPPITEAEASLDILRKMNP